MHSAFYATPLEVLLRHLHVRRVIVVGVSTDQCIVLTAGGARLRDLEVWVPSDAVASQTPRRNALALELIEHSLLRSNQGELCRGSVGSAKPVRRATERRAAIGPRTTARRVSRWRRKPDANVACRQLGAGSLLVLRWCAGI